MCGIYGQLHLNNTAVEPHRAKTACDLLQHRGPDAHGYLTINSTTKEYRLLIDNFDNTYLSANKGSNILLGHRRLSIIDLSAQAAQPMGNEDNTVWIIFNGEIYNSPALREELIKSGHSFRTDHSDTEVILHGWETWREKVLDYLRGMFAFCLIDLNTKTMFLARDRTGQKPLYYYYDNNAFVFASEIKAIVGAQPEISREIDQQAIAEYFSYGYILAPKSIFDKIKKLPPAHYLTLILARPAPAPKVQPYWTIQFTPDYSVAENEWLDLVSEELRESIRLRLLSDVPLGIFLSGGIDSSSVVALASKITNSPLKTFTIGFTEKDYTEIKWARQIARKYHTQHHEEIIYPDAIDTLAKLAWEYDEPFGDSSALPTYYVSKTTRKHVKVALAGDGGDELFAGYLRYQYYLGPGNRLTWLPYLFRRCILKSLLQTIPFWFKGRGRLTLLTFADYEKYCYQAYGIFWQDIYNLNFAQNTLNTFKDIWESTRQDLLTKMQYTDLKTYLPDDILVKVDRASMLCSLEVRSPFLDHKLIELATRIPSRLRMKDNQGKQIIKNMLRQEFDQSFLYRKKMGFALPLKHWFKSDLLTYLNDNLLATNSFTSSYISRQTIAKLISAQQKNRIDLSQQLWRLLMLEEWARHYLK